MTRGDRQTPLVSAIVSTYNAERFIRGKLEDLEAQTIAPELEIIVVDSGSRQNERAIVEEFQRRYPNIRYLRTEERETVYQAWNRGIRGARGEFVTNANTDDRLRRDCYERLVRALRAHPDRVLAYPDMRITQQPNATFDNHRSFGFRDWPEFDRISLLELCCVGPFPLWRRSLHDEIGYFDERFRSAADYEFWLRAALHHDFIHVPEFLGLYWLNDETVSRKGELPTLEYLEVQKEYRPKYAPLTPPPAVLGTEEKAGYRALLSAVSHGEVDGSTELERFIELHPNWPAAHHDLAELYYRKGEVGYAKKHFEKAAITDPASPLYREKLQAFLRSELYGSLQYHTAQAAATPDDVEILLALGMICVLMERFEAARPHYQRIVEIDPQNGPARENLAWLDARLNVRKPAEPVEPTAGDELRPEPEVLAMQENASSSAGSADYFSHERPEVQRLVSRRAKRVLDVGCAKGRTGGGIKSRQGAEVWGIESDAGAAAAAGEILDRVIAAPVEQALADLPERYFDTVILADVLEHLVEPKTVLEELLPKLAAGGELVVSLPNVRHWSVLKGLLEGSWEYGESGILDRTHLRFFTRQSAINLFESAGYAVTGVEPVLLQGESGMPAAVLESLLQAGVATPTLEGESAAYQYLFRLTAKSANLTSIVILTFNELAVTRECLESIERNTPEPHEVILVDNGSTDGTIPWLKEFCAGKSGYRITENGENLGFAAGCNIGMRAARGKEILLLNNDVVVTRGWLGGMLDCLQKEPAAGIVGPMTNRLAGPQQLPGTSYRNVDELEEFARSFRLANSGRRFTVDKVVGFCMLFTRRLYEEIGELDNRFGSGNFEDDDLCLRAALAGYGCVIAGDVFIHHYGSRSFTANGIDYAASMARNRTRFDGKWGLAALEESLARMVVTHNAVVKGRTLARRGRFGEAVDLLLQEGIKFSPTSPRPFLALAEILIDAGSFQDALEVIGQMPQGDELAKLHLAAVCELELGRVTKAEEIVRQALQMDPESSRILAVKGMIAAANGEAPVAQELFRSAMLADPGYGLPFTELSALKWQQGARDEALTLAELGFILAPVSMRALGRFHEYATACDELPREERRVREALEVYPYHKGLRYGVIELLIRGRRFAEAMSEIERAAVDFGLDDATLDAGLEIRRFAGPGGSAAKGKGSVSVCMIVKDEAQHLPSALLSVKGFADEIVVVDTGSSDRTSDIARLFGARIFSFPWNGSFADARNFSLSQAAGDWIFILDADEVLAASDLAPLTALVRRTSPPAAFSIVTRNYTDEITRKNWSANAGDYHAEERGRGWTPSEKVRLFPNDSRVRFDGAVHELLELSLMRCAIPIIACDVPVHHYGKLDAAKNLEKQERYYQLGLKKMNESGGTIEALTELAVQATELKRYREAEGLWQKVLQAQPASVDARFNLGYLHLSQGEYRKAHRYALEAAELAPAMKEAAFNLAKCDFFLGELPEALSRCEEMLQNVPDYPPALSLLSVTLLLMGRKREALSLVEQLRSMGFDCCDFLFEYADGLKKGEAPHLATPLLDLAEKLAGTALPPGVEVTGSYCHA